MFPKRTKLRQSLRDPALGLSVAVKKKVVVAVAFWMNWISSSIPSDHNEVHAELKRLHRIEARISITDEKIVECGAVHLRVLEENQAAIFWSRIRGKTFFDDKT